MNTKSYGSTARRQHRTPVLLANALFAATAFAQTPVPFALVMSQRVATNPGVNYSKPSLVQCCVGVNPPSANLPLFVLDGVACDVFPLARNAQGMHTAVHVAAPIPNVGGLPAIPGRNPATPTLSPGSTSPSPFQIPLLAGVQNLEISITPSGSSTMVCRPLDPAFAGRLASRTQFDGSYLEQEVVSSQFVTTPLSSTNEGTALIVYAIVTRRTDFPAVNLDLVVCNGAYDPQHNAVALGVPLPTGNNNPNAENRASDGPVFFRDMQVNLGAANLRAKLFAPRAGSFDTLAGSSSVTLVAAPPDLGPKTEVNSMYPGAFFTRRMCIYDPNAFGLPAGIADVIAQDIADRRDFGWAVGSLGYMSGGYAEGGWETPDLTFYSYNNASGWNAVYQRGAAYETQARVPQSITVQGVSMQYPGWFTAIADADHMPPSETHIELCGYTWPSNGEMVGRLILGDRYMERSYLAAVNVGDVVGERGWPLNDTAYARQGGGVFATGFSGNDATRYFMLPQHYVPAFNETTSAWSSAQRSAYDATIQNTALETPTLTLAWNRPTTAQASVYDKLHNWANTSGSYWGPLAWTHISRPTAMWRASIFGLNDTASRIAVEFTAHANSLASGRFDVTGMFQGIPHGNRHTFAKPRNNFFHIDQAVLGYPQNNISERGYWNVAPSGTPEWVEPPSARGWINGLAALGIHYAISSNTERTRWHSGLTGQGGNHDIRYLISRFYGHITMPSGIMFSTDDNQGAPALYTEWMNGSVPIPGTIASRSGNIPGGAFNGSPQHWAGNFVYQQAYAHGPFFGMQKTMFPGSGIPDPFAKIAAFADNWAASSDKAASLSGGTYAYFIKSMPTYQGTAGGHANPVPTLQDYRLGSCFWRGMSAQPTYNSVGTRYVESYALLAAWNFYSQGSWGRLLDGLARNFGAASTSIADVRSQVRAAFIANSNANVGSTDTHLANHLVSLLGALN